MTGAPCPSRLVDVQQRPRLIVAVLILVQFMVVLDAGVVNIALPAIRAHLGFTEAGLTWVIDAYLLTFGGFLLLGGRAADLLGRRRMFLIGLSIFTAASLGCGLAAHPWQLLAGRATQGLGAAFVSPAALALVTDVFDEGPERNRALGIWASMGGVAGAAGVLIGGLLTQIAWQWVFLVNIPIGVTVLVLGVRILPTNQPSAHGSVGVVDALTGTAGAVLLILAFVRRVTGAAAIAELVGAVILLTYFVIRQRRSTAPLVPPALFRARLMTGNALNAIVGAVLFATFFVVTLYLQHARGLFAAGGGPDLSAGQPGAARRCAGRAAGDRTSRA